MNGNNINSKFHPPAGGPKSKRKQGYTLIELVVVIGLSAILLLTAVSLFFTTFIGGGKTASAEYTKQAGGQVIAQVTYLLRNSRKLIPTIAGGQSCPAGNLTAIAVENQDGSTSVISTRSNGSVTGIAISSAVPPTNDNSVFLTPTELDVQNFSITCTPNTYGESTWDGSPPQVTIRFTLQKTGAFARDTVAIPYNSSITLRNY